MIQLGDLLGYLPPTIDGSLIHLMNDAPPGPCTRTSEEQQAVDWRRSMSLGSLHSFFGYQAHRAATQLILPTWRDQAPFGLYLRSFKLGGQRGQRTESWQITTVQTKDGKLQGVLKDRFDSEMPFLAIQNPAFDWTRSAHMPKLSLSETEWVPIVRTLIAAARVIVLYFADSSAGVVTELDMICESGRQSSTVLVLDSFVREKTPSCLGQAEVLEHRVIWDESEIAVETLFQLIEAVKERPCSGRFHPIPEIREPVALPDELRNFANYLARMAYLEALDHARSGEVLEGENALIRCLALCFFGDYPEGRALAYLELARAQYQGRGQAHLARFNYERSIDLYKGLTQSSDAARQNLSNARVEYEECLAASNAAEAENI